MPRSANPVPQYFDSDNKILAGGKVFYFNAGTSTPKTTYSDEGETIANPNPVVLDAAGRLPNVFFTGTAKQILKDLNDVQIWERDDVGSEEQASDFNAYDLNISYDAGDIVKFVGGFYVSLQNSNQNNQPDSSAAFWNEIRFIEVYNVNIDYDLGRIVQTSDGNLWKGVNSPNLANNPSTDAGTNWLPSIDESKLKDIVADTIATSGLATFDSLSVTNNTATNSLNVTNNATADSLNVTNNSVMNGIDAQDTDSVSLKRNASTVYARDDILGAVSESAGIPTGAIIEEGFNTEGTFTKYASGALVCSKSDVSSISGGSVILFPHPFVNNGRTVVILTSRSSLNMVTTAVNTTTTFNVFATVASTGANVTTVFNFIAIGRWY